MPITRTSKRRLTGEELLQRTDIWIEKDRYTTPDLAVHQNNPLIHSLMQPQEWSVARQLWRRCPPLDPNGRQYASHQRQLLLLDALSFFEPLEMHEQLDAVINSLWLNGYRGRNPISIHPRQTARDHLALIRAGLSQDIKYSPEPRVMAHTLIAFPGMGKIESIRNKFRQQPHLIILDTFVDTYGQAHKLDIVQIPWMLLTCPHDGSLRSLILEFFREYDFRLGTDFYSIYADRRYTTKILTDIMADFVKEHYIGGMGFDELQRLNLAASGGRQETLDFFVRLTDRLSVPCIFIGTPSTEPILSHLPHQIRRGDVLGDGRWAPLAYDDNWGNLIAALWPYQYLAQEVILTEEYSRMLHRKSQGIIDYAVKLYLLAQWYSIKTETERFFSPETIATAADQYLHFAKPLLEALESGDPAKISALQLDDLQPFEITHILKMTKEDEEGELINNSENNAEIIPGDSENTSAGAPVDTETVPATSGQTPAASPKGRVRKARTRRKAAPETLEGMVKEGINNGKTPEETLQEQGVLRPADEFMDVEEEYAR